MKNPVLVLLLAVVCITPAAAMEYTSGVVMLNTAFGVGTFSAGENDGGSVFIGGSLSLDWIPNGKTGLSYGIESALLGGATQNNIIPGIPILFRFGWHPAFFRPANIDIFILGKLGWAFGIWGSHLDDNASPNGVACGINAGGSLALISKIRAYTEIGYNYYGLARSDDHPEYPLGYGSGKVYAAAGLSFLLTGL